MDLIFINDMYFFNTKEMHLNKLTHDFNLRLNVPSTIPVWVLLPHLLLHCWNGDSLRSIENSPGCYIDKYEPKDGMFAYARICVEVDLEKGLLEAILLTLNNCKHI